MMESGIVVRGKPGASRWDWEAGEQLRREATKLGFELGDLVL